MTAPGPCASASTRAWVSGVPRGVISRRGRPSSPAASRARASTSARITMPGPPPAGVSSTERCTPRPWSRMSMVASDQAPFASALPARLKPSGPGNISGKIVRTVAGQVIAKAGVRTPSPLRERVRGGGCAERWRVTPLPPPSRATLSLKGGGELRLVRGPRGGSTTTRPAAMSTSGTTAFVNGSSRLGPPASGAISIRSPAPKLCSAATVPSTAPSGCTAARPIRSA